MCIEGDSSLRKKGKCVCVCVCCKKKLIKPTKRSSGTEVLGMDIGAYECLIYLES